MVYFTWRIFIFCITSYVKDFTFVSYALLFFTNSQALYSWIIIITSAWNNERGNHHLFSIQQSPHTKHPTKYFDSMIYPFSFAAVCGPSALMHQTSIFLRPPLITNQFWKSHCNLQNTKRCQQTLAPQIHVSSRFHGRRLWIRNTAKLPKAVWKITPSQKHNQSLMHFSITNWDHLGSQKLMKHQINEIHLWFHSWRQYVTCRL